MKIMMSGGMNLLALKIKNKLSSNLNIDVLLADFGDTPTSGNSINPILSLGSFNENVLAHQLLKICIDQQVDMYIPLIKQEWDCLDRARVLFSEFNITLGFPTKELEGNFSKSSKFQDLIFIYQGKVWLGEEYTKKLDFPFSIQDFSGILGVSLELTEEAGLNVGDDTLIGSDVANLSFITI